MSSKQFAEMEEAEFDSIIDGYIERTAHGYGEMPAKVYFDLLAERMEEQVEETVTLSINVTEDDLIIHSDRELGDILIQGNEIVIGKHRFILQLSH